MNSASDDNLGIVFPLVDGARGSSVVGREVLAAAIAAIDQQRGRAARAERNWRSNYPSHVRALVEASVQSADAPLAAARAGLASIAATMRFARDGAETSLAEAMAAPAPRLLRTASITGGGPAAPAPLAVPYRGRPLAGDALLRQLDEWESRGIVEPSFTSAIRRVQANPDWLDLSDQHFVLLGAAAELGPYEFLARRRARLVAVDVPRPALWKRLIATARAGNATLHLPLHGAVGSGADDQLAQHAGADLLTETPEIAAWLDGFGAPLTIGAYAYLDGAKHLRVAVAMDALQVRRGQPRPDTMLAMLGTPTDVCAVPTEVMQAAHARYAQRPLSAWLWQQPLRRLSGGRLFERNVEPAAAGFGIADALVVQQGPNYALAKRLQQWRALVARADGCRVSTHVAPPSLTGSVLSNRMMAAAYRSASLFGVEAFEPATASSLMAALLVHDLRHPQSAANPHTPLAHPLLLLADAAHHGGLWRMPFAARSALPVAAVIGALRPR